jgi:hypothetical protein
MVPQIKRARFYWLYDKHGNRILDLCQDSGFALLGYRPSNLTRTIKNCLSQGLTGGLPSRFHQRIINQLNGLYPDFPHVYLFNSLTRAEDALEKYLNLKSFREAAGDNLGGVSKPVLFLRPLIINPQLLFNNTQCIIPLLPFRIGAGPAIVCARQPVKVLEEEEELIPPVHLAGLLKSIYLLKKCAFPGWFREDLLKDCPDWQQTSIYIQPKFNPVKYKEIFDIFLQNKVLLSYDYAVPSLFPQQTAPGELRNLLSLFKQYPGEL